MTQQPHYHVFHGLPGYLPNGDVPEPGLDFRSALSVLASDLSEAASKLTEAVNEGEDTDGALENEADNVHRLSDELERAAYPYPGTDRWPESVKLAGDRYPLDVLAESGLAIDVYEGTATAVRYEIHPCWETECEPEEE